MHRLLIPLLLACSALLPSAGFGATIRGIQGPYLQADLRMSSAPDSDQHYDGLLIEILGAAWIYSENPERAYLFDSSGSLLGSSAFEFVPGTLPMARDYWYAPFRSSENRFPAFRGVPSTLIDYAFISSGVGDVTLVITGAPALPSELIESPTTFVIAGWQSSSDGISWNGTQQIIVTNYGIVPEPTSSLLLGLGLASIVGRRTRKPNRRRRGYQQATRPLSK